MTAALGTFTVKSRDDIRDDILRALRAGLINRGVSNPNVGPKSDYWVWAESVANELVVVESNGVIASDDIMPDTATGPGLDRWLAAVRLVRRPAAGSLGNIVADVTSPSLVALGQQLIDGGGLRYQVSVGGTYSDGDIIPVAAIDVGVATNHDPGDSLTWVGAAPPYSAPTVLVAHGGLTEGVDLEDDETARSRLLARLQNPPGAGNWQQLAEFGEASTPRVQKCFVYPAAQGPATVHTAVVGYATTTNTNAKSKTATRDIASAVMTGTVTPYITGLIAEHAYLVSTTVANVTTDVAMGLSLPAAPTASPPGPGGGWLDGTPWPPGDPTGSPYPHVYVDYVGNPPVSSTVFTVYATARPTAGVSHICWLDPVTWTLYRARVVSYTVIDGLRSEITIDTPFVGIESRSGKQFIFPDAVNMPAYVQALLGAFSQMGPGEKTTDANVLPRAFRHPLPQLNWPYSLDATQLRKVEDVGEEVLAAQWQFRSVATPAVPGAITSPPNILIPNAIGFYPAQ